jgi:hypothetical protein
MRCPKCGADQCERCPKCHALPLWRNAHLETDRLAIETCHGCGATMFHRRALKDDRPIEIEMREPLPVPDEAWRRGQPPSCHPLEEHFARGLCNACYQRWRANVRVQHNGIKIYGRLTAPRSR